MGSGGNGNRIREKLPRTEPGALAIPANCRVAILQSAYIPWKGYFDIIGSVDRFVIYDDVQYSKNHWHNRNLIKTKSGTQWLTIPVSKGGSSFQAIDQVVIAQPFVQKHWRSIEHSYRRAPFFETYRAWLAGLYEAVGELDHLSAINRLFLEAICERLDIKTQFVTASEMGINGGQTERLVDICRALGATTYLTGPSAQSYLDVGMFDAAGIAVEWMDYADYPEYGQMHGPFDHAVTILDLLLNVGPEARAYMKSPARSLKSKQW